MGRQVSVSMSEKDEGEFLAFLRSGTDIQIIRSFARSPAALFIDRFEPPGPGHWTYYIWNRKFDWQPTFAPTRADLPDPESRALYYVSNISVAPVLQYCRQAPGPRAAPGRVYWGKDFSAPNGLAYDVEAFARWYESIAHWLRSSKRGVARSNTLQRTHDG